MKKEGLFEKFLTLTGRNYWRMTTHDLELKASKYQIGEYAVDKSGWTGVTYPVVSRKRLIEQLIFRDKFISSLLAEVLSVIAIIISIVAIF